MQRSVVAFLIAGFLLVVLTAIVLLLLLAQSSSTPSITNEEMTVTAAFALLTEHPEIMQALDSFDSQTIGVTPTPAG